MATQRGTWFVLVALCLVGCSPFRHGWPPEPPLEPQRARLAEAPPPLPTSTNVGIPYSSEYRRMLASVAPPKSYTPLVPTRGLSITSLTLDASNVTLAWSGSTQTVQVQCRASLTDDWRNVQYPTTVNPLTFSKPFSAGAMFRLLEVTNQIDLGPYYVGSQYASTNGQGLSAMILFDPSAPHLVTWDRQKHVTFYDLPGMDNTSVGISCETAWAGGHLIVAFVPGNNLSLQINEYAFTPNPVLVNSLHTGNENCRWVDTVCLSSGVVVVSCYQQTNDLVGWFCHRTVQGAWVDDKEQLISGGYSNPAGMMRIAEMPKDHSLYCASTKDGGGSVRLCKIGLSPSFHFITNFTLCSDIQTSQPPDKSWLVDSNQAPHPEYLIRLTAFGDAASGNINLAYPNFLGGTSWDANGQHYILTKIVEIATDGIGKSEVSLTPGVTERVGGGIALGNGIIYSPMTQPTMPYYPMTKWDGNRSTLMFPLTSYYNIFPSRSGVEVVATRDDNEVIVVLK